MSVITTMTHTTASVISASQQILAANANRLYTIIINDSAYDMYIALGATAKNNFGIKLSPNGYYEMSGTYGNIYKGAINAISTAVPASYLLVNDAV